MYADIDFIVFDRVTADAPLGVPTQTHLLIILLL